MQLTESQINQFQDQGYVALPGFFDPPTERAMQIELSALTRAKAGSNVMPENSRRVNYRIVDVGEKSSLFQELPVSEMMQTVLDQLIGRPRQALMEQIFIKPAKTGAGNPWHTDNACFKVNPVEKTVCVWVALTDSNRENGTLELVPGSFKSREIQCWEIDLIENFNLCPPPLISKAIPIELKAGGAVFFNFGVLHCTRDNPSSQDRASLVFHFANRSPQASPVAFATVQKF